MKELERPVNNAAPNDMGWGSDVAAEMLRKLNIKYVSLNPGASYRGFHDSLVNYLGNGTPQMLLCLHEDHVVSIAHGYAKVADEPMACVLHSNVGLMHGLMGGVQRLVRPDADPGARRHGAGRGRQAAALDRLDSYREGSGRAAAQLHEMG